MTHRKYGKKKNNLENFFRVGILKVIDEKSRIRIRNPVYLERQLKCKLYTSGGKINILFISMETTTLIVLLIRNGRCSRVRMWIKME
jgi:hypothetical protein